MSATELPWTGLGQGPVVAALDGSALAERTLPLAAALARRTGRPLHLVTAHRPLPRLPEAGDTSGDPEWEAATAPGQEEYLESIAVRLRDDELDVTVAVPTGPAAPTLLAYAARTRASLLALSTHGRGGLNRLWVGSTLDRVLRSASLPLLVIPAAAAWTPDPAGIRRILIPLDGSRLAEAVLGPAAAVAAALRADVRLLRVVLPTPAFAVPHVTPAAVADDLVPTRRAGEAETYLEGIGRRLEETLGRPIAWEVPIASTRPLPEAILAAARDADAGLVALATHGRGGLTRLVLGSVADKVIRASELPLLIVRPAEDAAP